MDAYVDVKDSIFVYRTQLGQNLTVKLFQNADHGLLRAVKAVPDHSGFRGFVKILMIAILGEKAFVDNYFDFIGEWLSNTSKNGAMVR